MSTDRRRVVEIAAPTAPTMGHHLARILNQRLEHVSSTQIAEANGWYNPLDAKSRPGDPANWRVNRIIKAAGADLDDVDQLVTAIAVALNTTPLALWEQALREYKRTEKETRRVAADVKRAIEET